MNFLPFKLVKRKRCYIFILFLILFGYVSMFWRIERDLYLKWKLNFWRHQRIYNLNKDNNLLYSVQQFNVGNSVPDKYFEIINENTIECKYIVTIDKLNNGGIDLCIDGSLNFVKSNCLIYSFKVDYLWSFDDQMSVNYGCSVRTFIPAMESYYLVRRKSNVMYYNLGLGNKDEEYPKGFRFRTFGSLLRQFKDDFRIIDILKIDIDFGEWDAFESMFEDTMLFYVKQIVFESHTEEIVGRKTSSESFIRFLNVWKGLHDFGFRQWQHKTQIVKTSRFTKYSDKYHCCFIHYLINIHYL